MKYAIGVLVLLEAAVLTVCTLTLDSGSLVMVVVAMAILTVCGTAPVALGVLTRRRTEGGNAEREEIIRLRDSAAGQDREGGR